MQERPVCRAVSVVSMSPLRRRKTARGPTRLCFGRFLVAYYPQMKRVFFSFIVTLFLSACATQTYTGLWIAPDSESALFELDLVQTGERIEGYHSAVLTGGNQIDAVLRADNAAPSIRGTVIKGDAHVDFEVRHRQGNGDAILKKMSYNKILWTRGRSSGGQSLPESCVLVRQANQPH